MAFETPMWSQWYAIRRAYQTTKVETTINIDEETWNRFKRGVSSSQGSLRSISGVVEEEFNLIS